MTLKLTLLIISVFNFRAWKAGFVIEIGLYFFFNIEEFEDAVYSGVCGSFARSECLIIFICYNNYII